MKIDSTNQSSNTRVPSNGPASTQQAEAASTATAAATTAGTASSAGASGGDANVNLSALSSQLRSLAASGDADIDTTQVESIKDAIRNGTLQIDTGKIADGVLDTVRNLLQSPSAG
ncbi:flagellar biosynthesis anti-sigma factor FlgM [Burkholderia sp. WAC0059]|uniref:flagellar biosynthesis anti-sigma factor FlgM n=1 Tax=Burkholderia sp. WAC0059 TaxID=2066022 RepID=UPI000C7F4F66|nr:flagellar biosynthesis anti-sigma factor FlgM [Burkholderia sp. WAC0059]PLZ00656.1 flagellar biosynthesis anti-sigma factor FlgM [Burkholderia sp. WAC0059]